MASALSAPVSHISLPSSIPLPQAGRTGAALDDEDESDDDDSTLIASLDVIMRPLLSTAAATRRSAPVKSASVPDAGRDDVPEADDESPEADEEGVEEMSGVDETEADAAGSAWVF